MKLHVAVVITITDNLRLAENLFSFLVLLDFFRQLSQTKLEEEKSNYSLVSTYKNSSKYKFLFYKKIY